MDVTQANPDLAALIGSRICHDLISPIGAIGNGLELLEMAGGTAGPEFSLISASVENAGARIRFFRIAYGAADDRELTQAEVAGILADVAADGRVAMTWQVPGPRPRRLVRLAFLALQCCETALPHGGEVRVSVDGAGWQVTGHGQRLQVDPALWDGLNSGRWEMPITPALVQFALLPPHAAEAGRNLQVDRSGDEVRLRF